jgi:hypothetical protein
LRDEFSLFGKIFGQIGEQYLGLQDVDQADANEGNNEQNWE